MAKKRMTPPLGIRGRFSVITPFTGTVREDYVYEAVALRQFEDLLTLGIDIVQMFYTPYGLTATEYAEDLALDAVIVTLMDPQGVPIYIPDTYISKYPDSGNVAYNRVVLAVDLGILPAYLDLTHCQQQVSGVVSDTVGLFGDREPQTYVTVAPARGAITAEQHEIIEVNRVSSITNRATDRAKAVSAEATITALRARIALLEEIIANAGLSN